VKNRDKFIRGLAASNPTTSSTTSGTRSASRSRGRAATRGWDNQTTGCAACQRPLPLGHRPGLRGTPTTRRRGGLPAEDELPDRHLYDFHRSRQAREARRPFVAEPKTVRRAPAAPGTIRTSGPTHPHRLLELGRGFISATARPVHSCSSRAPPTARRTRRSGPVLHAAQDSRCLLDCYEVGGNQKALAIARGMAHGSTPLASPAARRASACGTATSPASTAASTK